MSYAILISRNLTMSVINLFINILIYSITVYLSITILGVYFKNRIDISSHEFRTYKRLVVISISFVFLLKSALFFSTESLTVLFFVISIVCFYARIGMAMFSDYKYRKIEMQFCLQRVGCLTK